MRPCLPRAALHHRLRPGLRRFHGDVAGAAEAREEEKELEFAKPEEISGLVLFFRVQEPPSRKQGKGSTVSLASSSKRK